MYARPHKLENESNASYFMECRLQTNSKPNSCSQPPQVYDQTNNVFLSLSLSRGWFFLGIFLHFTKFGFLQRISSVVSVATNYMNAWVTCDQLNIENCIFVQMWATSSTWFNDLAEMLAAWLCWRWRFGIDLTFHARNAIQLVSKFHFHSNKKCAIDRRRPMEFN